MSPSRGEEASRPLLDGSAIDDYDDSPRSSDDVLLLSRSPRFRRGGRRKMEKKTLFTKAFVRLHLLCIFFAVGSFCWGYNVGILASVLVHKGFIKELDDPDASKKGVITAIYYLGTWTSYVFISRAASDKLGRRFAALAGIFVTCCGTALQAAASGDGAYAMFIIGRIIAGVGVGIVSTSVPLYQSEISPAKKRGKFVVMNHIGFVAGLASGFWYFRPSVRSQMCYFC